MEIGRTNSGDIVGVDRADLYALLDRLNSMHMALMALWDPDATIHPLNDARRQVARKALLSAIVDVRNWLDQGELTSEKQ